MGDKAHLCPNIAVRRSQHADPRVLLESVVIYVLQLPGKVFSTENSAIPGCLNLPYPVLTDDDDMPRIAHIARLRVGDAPVKAFRAWHTTAVEHPPGINSNHELDLESGGKGIPIGIHAEGYVLDSLRLDEALLELLPENHGRTGDSCSPFSRTAVPPWGWDVETI